MGALSRTKVVLYYGGLDVSDCPRLGVTVITNDQLGIAAKSLQSTAVRCLPVDASDLAIHLLVERWPQVTACIEDYVTH